MDTSSLTGFKTFPIYNADDSPFHDLVLRRGVVDSIVMSLGDKITGEVYYPNNSLQVTMKEYIKYDGIHYYLVNPPTVVREGIASDNSELHGMTKYSFEFYHPMYQLSNFPFTDVATKTGEEKYLSQNKSFSWIGKPQDYIDKLNKNLQGTVWYVRKSDRFPIEKDDELSGVQQFDKVSVAEAVKRGYEIWGTPYIVSQLPSNDPLYAQGKRFVVEYGLPSNEIYASDADRQTDNPYVFRFGQGVGLKNNSRTPRNNKIITRIAGYGSEDNVPYGYPQIVWTGNQDWDYTIDNDPDNPLSYPIYKGIVGGQYVKLIKHPFTRSHLMPSIYSETVFNKVSPYLSNGQANPSYNPAIEIKDYYDAIATQEYPYVNEINPQAPSYENHEFADIKPELDSDRSLGIVNAVPLNADLTPADHWDDSMDDDGNYLQSYFQITLPQLPFDLYACAAITQEMQVNMRSGDCIGCTFTVQVDWEDYKRNFYDSDGNFVPDGEQRDLTKYPKSNLGQINVIVKKDNSTFGTLMPNIYQQPKADDLFVFIGISLPTSYITNAEVRLDAAMKSYMLENNVYYFDYPLKFDEHFLVTHTYILEQIRPNSIIHFDYGGVEQQLFVKQLTIKYNNTPLPQFDITLTDNVEVVLNQIGQVVDDVEKLSTLISILRQSYSRNVWIELANKLSKTQDDTAKGWITILKGVRTLSDFIELSKGGALYTDEDTLAHLTADVARIRERILGTLRIGDTTASVHTEPTLHVGGDTLVDNDLQVAHNAEIVGILEALNHIYTNLLTSDNYTDDSAFGIGFRLSKKKRNENRSYLVVDELFVRWKAIFNELEIRRMSYTGGNRVSSHAASKIIKVKDILRKMSYSVADTVLTLAGQVNVVGSTLNIDGGVTVNDNVATLTTNSVTYAKRCYAMKDDGTTATMNWWKVNDQARCQTFNIVERGTYQKASNKSYWRRVLAVGYEKIEIDGTLSEEAYDYVDLSVADCMTGSDMPEEGDTIVQMGNRTDTSRQGFIVSEVVGESAPDIQIFRNVNSYTLEGKRKIILSPDDTHLRVNSLVIETEYDARRVPMERGDWDAIPEHKCYYYDLVQYNGATWLCVYPESGIGGIKYTTELPSESSLYWQIYAQKGTDGTPATVYGLIVSLSSIKKNKDGTPAVAVITATRQKTIGSTTSDTTDGTLTYKIDGGSEKTYTTAIHTNSVSTGVEFIFRVNETVVDRKTAPVIMDGQDGTNGLPSAYLNLSDPVVDIEVNENGNATKLFYEEIDYNMSASGKTLYIKSVDVSMASHVSIPAYKLSPLADGLITVSGTTATLTKGGATVSGNKATLPYGYTALPQIVVSAQEGETINEGTVTFNAVAVEADGNEYTAMSILKVARQYNIKALQLVLSQDTIILTQDESGDIILTDAYTELALRIGGTDITTDLSIATEVSQFYDEEDERYINSCNVSVVDNRVRITDIGSYSYIPSGSTDEKIVYCETGYVDITVIYHGVPYTKRWQFYCNLLGSWKEEIEGDVDRAIAESTTYEVDGQKYTVKDNLGEFVKSSTENTSKISQRVESVEDGKNIIKQLTSGWVGADPSVDSITYLDRFGIEDGSIDMYSPVIRLKAYTDYCFSAYFDYSPENDSAYVIEPVSDRTYNNGKELYDSGYGTTPQITWHNDGGRYYFTLRTGASDTLFAFNYYRNEYCVLYRPQMEEGNIPTEFYASSYEQSSLVKQTKDALTIQINGKATQSDINIAADQITATIKSKLGETGINIDDKTITMKAEQTIFKDLSGREMISFEMVEYDGDNLPSLVFWDNKGKKGGNKSFILNWKGLIDMAQHSTSMSWENVVMYGTLSVTDDNSFTEGMKIYAKTLWYNTKPHEGEISSIIRVTKYMYNAGYTISDGRKIWNPANAGNYDGKMYESNDTESYLPTGVVTAGWYITEITEYEQDTEVWRKMFSFTHYTGGMPDSSFVVCVDILYAYDTHGQIISTTYQIVGSLTDQSVTTGSDTGGDYIIIPTVNN